MNSFCGFYQCPQPGEGQNEPESRAGGKIHDPTAPGLEWLFSPEQKSKVGYRHGENGAKQETMDYLEFIARVLVRYRQSEQPAKIDLPRVPRAPVLE